MTNLTILICQNKQDMAYSKKFIDFAYATIMNDILQKELPTEDLNSPFLEDVCPDPKISIAKNLKDIQQLIIS